LTIIASTRGGTSQGNAKQRPTTSICC